MRNKPMVDNTLALLGEQAASSKQQARGAVPQLAARSLAASLNVAVLWLVLSTPPITQICARRTSAILVVITHPVDKITDADHELYVKRLSGNLFDRREVLPKPMTAIRSSPKSSAKIQRIHWRSYCTTRTNRWLSDRNCKSPLLFLRLYWRLALFCITYRFHTIFRLHSTSKPIYRPESPNRARLDPTRSTDRFSRWRSIPWRT